PQPLRLAPPADDVREMLKFISETRSLARSCLEGDSRFDFWKIGQNAINRFDDSFESGLFACAKVRPGMHDQERQFKLVRASKFLGQRANRIRVKLSIRRSEVNEVISVAKNRQQLTPLDMIEESTDFAPLQGACKPLHVVLYENMHRGALDRKLALNSHDRPSAAGHMRTQ